MEEVFLYGCERCGVVRYETYDRGPIFYIDKCSACKEWSDFKKIVPGVLNIGSASHYGFKCKESEDGYTKQEG